MSRLAITQLPVAKLPRIVRLKLGALLLAAIAYCVWSSPIHAQETWRGLTVPAYVNATDYRTSKDEDEYEMRFRSQDGVQAVFEFYRDYLQRQGFRVADSASKQNGFKANMVRGQGGPNDTIELDVRMRSGLYKVEIEFDD